MNDGIQARFFFNYTLQDGGVRQTCITLTQALAIEYIYYLHLIWSYMILTCFSNIMDLEWKYCVLLPIPTELPEQVTEMT